jgi:hypothetical protein
VIPGIGAGTQTVNIDAPGWGSWFILLNGQYVSRNKGTSATVPITLGYTTWVDFTQQPPPEPNIWIEPNHFDVTAFWGEMVNRTLAIGNNGTDALDFDINESVLLFRDDMESGPSKWLTDSPWGLTTSSYASPTHSWTDSPAGNYSNNVNTSLTLSGAINLSPGSNAVLKFRTRYTLETGYDYGRIEVSSNGGPWTQIASVNGSQSDWTQVSYSLNQFTGQSIRIRFRLTTDSSVIYDGWYLDDVEVIDDQATIDWCSQSPTNGTVPPGEHMDVNVTFDPLNLGVGGYDGTIAINSNDMNKPVIYIPIRLTVIGAVQVDTFVTTSTGLVSFDRRTGQFSVDVKVKNTSTTEIGEPVWLVINGISNPGVTLASPDGTTADGKPYINLSGLLGDGKLSPGETISKRIYFNNPKRLQFTFTPSVRGIVAPG